MRCKKISNHKNILVIRNLLKEILRNSMNPLTPNYIGHMDSIPTLISCLGEFVTTMLNNNMLSLEMSPVFSQFVKRLI